MRYFLVILAMVMASLGYTQTASAQACTGFALLKDGDQYVGMGVDAPWSTTGATSVLCVSVAQFLIWVTIFTVVLWCQLVRVLAT